MGTCTPQKPKSTIKIEQPNQEFKVKKKDTYSL
jgi:hypothetical protein